MYRAAGINENTTNSDIMKFATYNTTFEATVPAAVTFSCVGRGAKTNLTVLTGSDPMAFSFVGTNVQLIAGRDGVFTSGLSDLAVAVLATMPKGYAGITGLDTKFARSGVMAAVKAARQRRLVEVVMVADAKSAVLVTLAEGSCSRFLC